jgi:hypothetical protein
MVRVSQSRMTYTWKLGKNLNVHQKENYKKLNIYYITGLIAAALKTDLDVVRKNFKDTVIEKIDKV